MPHFFGVSKPKNPLSATISVERIYIIS